MVASIALIRALRDTAARLSDPEVPYRWTHQGACNCGHLAQTVTRLSPAELHRMALQKDGDWSEHALDHCPTSGYPIDAIIDRLLELGLSPSDLANLERLSDPRITRRVGRHLDFRRREDVVAYLGAWAQAMEEVDGARPG